MTNQMRKLNADSKRLLVEATKIASRLGAPTTEAEHVIVAALASPLPQLSPLARVGLSAEGAKAALMAYAPPTGVSPRPPRLGATVADLVSVAGGACASRNLTAIPPSALVAAALSNPTQPVTMLMARFLQGDTALRAVNELLAALDRDVPRATSLFDQDNPQNRPGAAKETVSASVGGATGTAPAASTSKTPTLSTFGRELVAAARNRELTPTIGRTTEMDRMIGVLSRRSRSNPVVVGDAGVGKTAVVEGLAARVARGDVPPNLADIKIWEIDTGALIAGTTLRGDVEKRVKALLAEVAANPDHVLFFDEIHSLVGAGAAGGSLSVSQMFKPPLARGELRVIGATTTGEYRRYFEKDAALTRRFTPIEVSEPDTDSLHDILAGWVPTLAAHHGVIFDDGTVAAAARLARRHLTDRRLPDSAVDLLDEAAASVGMARRHAGDAVDLVAAIAAARRGLADQNRIAEHFELADALADALCDADEAGLPDRMCGVVSVADIETVCADWAGLDVGAVSDDETSVLLNLEVALSAKVIGQPDAVDAVTRAVRRRRSPFAAPRPTALLFAGPTGVGKTELAKSVADAVSSPLVVIDCSELQHSHTVSRLIGAPPGYVGHNEGGQLTEALRRNPGAVVLFDEVEKADPRIFDILLSLLEDGRITDAAGRKVDASSAIIILTSNLGTTRRRTPGFGTPDTTAAADRNAVLDAVKSFFRIELINRLDEIVVFDRLDLADMVRIVDLLVARPVAQLADLGITASFTDAALERLAVVSFDDELGARPARRTITNLFENVAANELLAGHGANRTHLCVDVDDTGTLTFDWTTGPVPAVASTDSTMPAGTV